MMKNSDPNYELNLKELNIAYNPKGEDIYFGETQFGKCVDYTREIYSKDKSKFIVYTKEDAITEFGRCNVGPCHCVAVKEGFIDLYEDNIIDYNQWRVYKFYFSVWLSINEEEYVSNFLEYHYSKYFSYDSIGYAKFLNTISGDQFNLFHERYDIVNIELAEFINSYLQPVDIDHFRLKRDIHSKPDINDFLNSVKKHFIPDETIQNIKNGLFYPKPPRTYNKLLWVRSLGLLREFLKVLKKSNLIQQPVKGIEDTAAYIFKTKDINNLTGRIIQQAKLPDKDEPYVEKITVMFRYFQ